MATKQEVEHFLKELKTKIKIFQLLVRDDRGKNLQTLLELEISPNKRKEIIEQLTKEDYYQGPVEEQLYGLQPMWMFGKVIKGSEVYIKITMGLQNSPVICISFHFAEHVMNYPFKP